MAWDSLTNEEREVQARYEQRINHDHVVTDSDLDLLHEGYGVGEVVEYYSTCKLIGPHGQIEITYNSRKEGADDAIKAMVEAAGYKEK